MPVAAEAGGIRSAYCTAMTWRASWINDLKLEALNSPKLILGLARFDLKTALYNELKVRVVFWVAHQPVKNAAL